MDVKGKIQKTQGYLNRLKALSDNLKRQHTNLEFSVEELEFIHRVITAIYPQIKHTQDKLTAKTILEKTEWISELSKSMIKI